MTEASADLTPPTKAAKAAKAPKEAKPAKEPKAPKEVVLDAEGNPVKTARGPKKDYGYSKNALIKLTDKANTYRGQRKEWYDRAKAFEGKTCAEFEAAHKGIPNNQGTIQQPRGWLHGLIRRGSVVLVPGAPEAEAPKAA